MILYIIVVLTGSCVLGAPAVKGHVVQRDPAIL